MKHRLTRAIYKFFIFPALLICLLLAGCEQGGPDAAPLSGQISSKTENGRASKEFDRYTDELFASLAASDSLTFHYTVHDVDAFNEDYLSSTGSFFQKQVKLKQPEASFGLVLSGSAKGLLSYYENIRASLQQFSGEELSYSQQLTYETLTSYLDYQTRLADMFLYGEPLSPLNGVQVELPILLAEYQFCSTDDIETYFSLLKCFPAYLAKIAEFEKEKADAGLFMSKDSFLDVLKQCDSFLEADYSHFMYTTFSRRIKEAGFLTEKERSECISRNETLLEHYFFPAYRLLKENLAPLAGFCRSGDGLCFLAGGRQYYEAMAQYSTGTDYTIPQLQQLIAQSLQNVLQEAAMLFADSPELALNTSAAPELDVSTGEEMMAKLTTKMQGDFILDTVYPYRLEKIDESLEDDMAPAFYLTAPLDDVEQNVIYVNGSKQMEGLDLFTTLAHEGYPGHLYQNAVLRNSDVCYLRQLLSFPGYTEGWATYAELLSYGYAGLDPALADYYRLERTLLLGLYAYMETGVHYDGWNAAQLQDFLSTYGMAPDEESLDSLYQLIGQNAGGYLKYYIGYLEMESLRGQAKNRYGDGFSERAFHAAVLNMGPAPFSVLEEYLPFFWNEAVSY